MEDFYTIALSRLRNMVLPMASEKGDVALMAEVAKIEAILAVVDELRNLRQAVETLLPDQGEEAEQ